jgi:hypothetical protein
MSDTFERRAQVFCDELTKLSLRYGVVLESDCTVAPPFVRELASRYRDGSYPGPHDIEWRSEVLMRERMERHKALYPSTFP